MNKKKTLLYGSRAAALTIVVVLVVLLLNAFTGYFVEQFPQAKLDITPERRYSLSNEAKDYLKSVSTPIKIIALGGQNYDNVMVEMQYVRDTAARMAKQNEMITYEVFELYKDQESMENFLATYVETSEEVVNVFSVILENPENGEFRVATPEVMENAFELNVSYVDFESKVCNAINSLLNGADAETVTIPDKPEYRPELLLGTNPETRQFDEALLGKQMLIFTLIFVIAFPLCAFILSILVFALRRKK